MKDTKDFYNKTALAWANEWYENEAILPCIREFFEYLPPNPRVLDLCCGAGYESMRMKNLGANVAGLDFSEESIKIAKEKNPEIMFVIEDMLYDYSYLGKFDGCAVIAGLVHLQNEQLSRAFGQIAKVLNDNGFLFVAIKDGTGKSEKSSYTTIDDEDYDRNFYLHTIEEINQFSIGIFEFVKELQPNTESIWKYYIYKKCMGSSY